MAMMLVMWLDGNDVATFIMVGKITEIFLVPPLTTISVTKDLLIALCLPCLALVQ